MCTFSIIVVTLNPGEAVNASLESVFMQSCKDYEVIVKDGGSKDLAIDALRNDDRVRFYEQKDTGIYDAMNQAIGYAKGQYLFFLNAGDRFYDAEVLADFKKEIEKHPNDALIYGDVFLDRYNAPLLSCPKLTRFSLYRTMITHQAIFFNGGFARENLYDTRYRITADYEMILRAILGKGRDYTYLHRPVAYYMGGGVSEKKEGVERSKKERKQILEEYFSPMERCWFQFLFALTLPGLRKRICTTGFYRFVLRVLRGLKR